MATAAPNHHRRTEIPFFTSSHGTVYYRPWNPDDPKARRSASPNFPTPHISPRQRRPHTIHIISYPPNFVPPELRSPLGHPVSAEKPPKRKKAKDKQTEKQKRNTSCVRRVVSRNQLLRKLLALFSQSCLEIPAIASISNRRRLAASSESTPEGRPTPQSSEGGPARPGSREEAHIGDGPMTRTATMMEAVRPSLANATLQTPAPYRYSNSSIRSAKTMASSSVTDLSKPVASGSGLSCSIILAEPTVFLTGFEHDGHTQHASQNSTALLRGKLQLNVSKNVKLKSVTLKLLGKARTEWPEGIPPLKVDLFEEESLRTQALTFFHAMHDGWETEYGNQCTFSLKSSCSPNSSSTNLSRIAALSPSQSVVSLHLTDKSRRATKLSAKELKRLSLQSVQSRSFGKGDSPMANSVQARGFKVFYPGTYEYSFELPIDHHQLETAKLQYGSVKWELQTTVERAGAFKANLNGSREVTIVRLPDQLSLEMTEPISISRQWEDQLHYDIMISGKSFPIGAKIPIAFKLTPLAKVHIHKIKVFVTESAEYWTNDRRVTRKDPGRKILLLEKAAGKPLDKQYDASEVRILNGGELSPDERAEARAAAQRRRNMEAARTNGVPEPLPEPSDNLLGDLELGLESYWGSTEMEMNVQLPTCEMMAKDKLLRLNPDCSWKNVNVFHWIKIVMRISRIDPEDPTGQRRRHFEISIDSPFTVLNCRATQANTALPQYTSPERSGRVQQRQQLSCGCPDGACGGLASTNNTTLPLTEIGALDRTGAAMAANAVSAANLPLPPQAAHVHTVIARSTASPSPGLSMASMSPIQRIQEQESGGRSRPQSVVLPETFQNPRPIHLLRVPSYNPPAFDADDPPPPLPQDLLTPPPNYDVIIGTPSVDGLADYFQRLADYEEPDSTSAIVVEGDRVTRALEVDDDSDSADEAGGPARILERTGRVNVANPRTPGGRLVPSRSLELERPVITLSMASVVRRGEPATSGVETH